jgi:hypothetical protein
MAAVPVTGPHHQEHRERAGKDEGEENQFSHHSSFLLCHEHA